MYNNSKVPQSNKTIDELKSKINAIPAEQIAGKLKLNLTKTGYSLQGNCCLLYTSPSPRDRTRSRMPSSAWKKKTRTNCLTNPAF